MFKTTFDVVDNSSLAPLQKHLRIEEKTVKDTYLYSKLPYSPSDIYTHTYNTALLFVKEHKFQNFTSIFFHPSHKQTHNPGHTSHCLTQGIANKSDK